MANVVSIADGHALGIDMCLGNQPNESKLAMCKTLMSLIHYSIVPLILILGPNALVLLL